MSAYRHANDGFRRYTGLLQHLANTATIGLPQLVHIPLHVSGPRGNHWCIPGGRTDLVPFQVKQRGFRYRPPVVQTEYILFLHGLHLDLDHDFAYHAGAVGLAVGAMGVFRRHNDKIAVPEHRSAVSGRIAVILNVSGFVILPSGSDPLREQFPQTLRP